jgi:lysozyme
MTYSRDGLHLTEQFEGCRREAYQDSRGIWTCGYGHTRGVGPGTVVTQAQAEEWLAEDVAEAEHAVNALVKVPLTQGQFDALVDFTFNLGAGTLERSTLLRLLNEKRYDYVADQFLAWDHAAGREVDGLKRRREAEREMFIRSA